MTGLTWFPLMGGILIGIAVSLMLVLNGRVTGVSGIVGRVLTFPKHDLFWRITFVAGLLAGGLVLRFIDPQAFVNTTERSPFAVAIAGLLVGFGTLMGSGCTSGHGVCGVSRFSIRSILSTLVFISFGMLSVAAVRFLLGGHV